MSDSQINENKTNPEENDEGEEIDTSGKVELLLYQEAKASYDRLWLLFNEIENKANGIIKRDLTYTPLIFVGVALLSSQNFSDVFWIVFTVLLICIAVSLGIAVVYSLKTLLVKSIKMFSPEKLIEMAETVPNTIKLYHWMIDQLKKVGSGFTTAVKEKGKDLRIASIAEIIGALFSLLGIIWIAVGYMFFKL